RPPTMHKRKAGSEMSEAIGRAPTQLGAIPQGSGASTYPWTMAPRNGRIEVAPRAIATVAGRAVAECYGVVGITARRSRFGRVDPLDAEHFSRGVVVRFADDHITIDGYVMLEHGLRIT